MRDVSTSQRKLTPSSNARPARVLSIFGLLAAALVPLVACEHDSYMDPSKTGRFEHTPTVVPILERLAAVEGPAASDMGETSQITQADLIPEVEAYRIDAGDGLEVLVSELFNANAQERFERLVDPRGMVELPNVPAVYVIGMTADEASQAISRAYKARRILNEPVVAVSVPARRRQTYHLMGGVNAPGTYSIPRPDFRLLEAVTQGGRFSEYVQYVYVIRSTALSDKAAGRQRPMNAESMDAPTIPAGPGGKVVDTTNQPATKKAESVIDLIDSLGGPDKKPAPAIYPSMVDPQNTPTPVIDIDQVTRPRITTTSTTTTTPDVSMVRDASSTTASPGGTRWVFIDGQWVASGAQRGTSTAKGVKVNIAQDVMTQRVIQIPMASLLAGSAQHNIVVRPGDVIRIPSPTEGLVYVEGQVQRPGPYGLPSVGRLTLTRAIVAAGGLSETAIPERMEITRFVGADRQAIVRLNYRAIKEGTQPDLFLREGDMINVGTNFWALPLAVIRNGFRASYGFGFILDRNFGFDVFGPQQTNGL